MGGMAEVFLCRQKGMGGFDKLVVVKRIRADIRDDGGYVDMFLDEARVAANLAHPNLVHIFEIDAVDGLPYIAMEYVPGPTLSNLLAKINSIGTRDYGLIAHLFAGIASGLHYAHVATDPDGQPLGIVHRDISPHNVIVSLDGVPKVFDFGVAKARGNLAMTSSGSIKGKIAYMAPEQLRAFPVDHRADIYALGVCLYEATCGRRPFRAETEAELFAARVRDEFPYPTELDPGFPPELEALILSCMDADFERRPSGEQIATALLRYSGTRGTDAKAVTMWMRELFPNTDATELAGEAYASNLGTGSRSRKAAADERSSRRMPVNAMLTQPMNVEPVSSRKRAGLFIGAALGSLAVAGGLYVFLARNHGEATAVAATTPITAPGAATAPATAPGAAIAATAPGAATAASATAAADVKLYLDEAERLAGAHRYDDATAMLAKAQAKSVDDAALTIRISRINDEIAVGPSRVAAQKALAANDRIAAMEAAGKVLEKLPDDADAIAVLEKAKAMKAAAAAAAPAAGAAKVALGSITVKTHANALIYLDGELVSRGSVNHLDAARGSHVVMVKLAGFGVARRTVTVAANRDSALAVALTPEVAAAPVRDSHAGSAAIASAAGSAAGSGAAPPVTTPTTPAVAAAAPPTTPNTQAVATAPTTPAVAATAPASGSGSATATAAAIAKPAATATAPAADEIAAPRLPGSYSARSMKELNKVLAVIEGEAIDRGKAPTSIRGVTSTIAEEAFANFAPGELIEVHPSSIYYTIVRSSRAGKSASVIAAGLRSAYSTGKLSP
jgi:hypothetical protein